MSCDLKTQLFDPEKARKDFPIFELGIEGKEFIYLDNAATAQKPRQVVEAMSHFYLTEYATAHRSVYESSLKATEKIHQVRRGVKAFLHAEKEEEIIFTKGATEALNLVAYSYGDAFIKEGDEILVSQMEHHANIVPWQLLAQRKRAKIVVIPMTKEGEIDLIALERLLTNRVKIVAICHASNALGTVNPIAKIAQMVHAVGAIIVVDGAQSVPHMEIDVVALGADFFAFSAHKLYGPTGIGVLYGKYELLEKMPPFCGGGDMVEWVTFEQTTYQPPPLKFEAGTPAIAEIVGLGAALTYLSQYNRKEIERHEKELAQVARERLLDLPRLKIIGGGKVQNPLIPFVFEGVHPLDLGVAISLSGVCIRTGSLCAQPALAAFGLDHVARLSFALYNHKGDIDKFFLALDRALHMLS